MAVGMWILVLAALLILAVCALFARGPGGVFAPAALPGALCAYSLYRLGEASHDGIDCGTGLAPVLCIAVATALSTAAALGVGALRYLLRLAFSHRHRGGLEFYTEPSVGFTHDPG